MAASFNESQKLDYLWKKLGYGVAKTSIPPPGSGSKEAFNESIASPLLYRGDLVWKYSGSIPASPPDNTSSIVQVYKDGGGGGYSATVQCTEDLTSPDNQTWKTNLTDWIPTQFGDNYLILVFVDTTGSTTPQTTGTRLFQAGSGSDDTWFFDYQAGILNFNGAVIPSVITGGVSGKSVFVVGYRYIGDFGVGGDTGNITFSDTTIGTASANTNINIMPTGNGVVVIDTVTGLVVPVGNTAQRPAAPDSGTVRLNNGDGLIEFYNGTGWVALSSAGGITITNQTINPDGSTSTYTLDQASTSASILVTINGVGQTPDIDYTVSVTDITFTTTPIPTDTIQIRFLAGVTSTDFLTNSTGNAVVQTTSSGNITLEASTGSNINATGNISATGNIAGNYVLGNGAYLTGLTPGYGNSNVAAYLPTYSGNISSGNISASGNITGGNVLGGANVNATTHTGTTVSVTGNITGGSLTVATGNITAGNIINANANGIGNIGTASTYFNTVFAKATSAQYADLAERFLSDQLYEPGTVLIYAGNEQVTACTNYADSRAAGIVSTNPAYLMNTGVTACAVSLALAGQVPCKVVGPMHKGEVLTTSTVEGYACKLDSKDWQPGVIVGKALENCGPGLHVILVVALS